MKLVLVALCALLGCACSQECEWDERVHMFPGGLALASALVEAENLDLDVCRARCCGHAPCDTAVVKLLGDGHGLCFLLHCGDACVYENDTNNEYRVFTRSDEHAPDNSMHVEPMMLVPSTRIDDQENNNNNNSSDVCTLPRVVGNCKAAFPRFFFDAESGSCQRFIYGGCGANANNFESQQECEDRCGGGTDGESPSNGKTLRMAALPQNEGSEEEPEETTEEAPKAKEVSEDDFKELCTAPPVVGPCRAALPRWFYNQSSSRCERFIYGGCRGNKNNHDSEEHCSSTCSGVKLLPSKKQVPELSDEDKAHCTAAPESGPCRAAFTMFYFDSESQSCKTFLYGGCRGNNNRYGSESECQERCAHAGASEGRGQVRNRWTAAFFLFLTLAAVSFLLLTSLIFITMRRNRNPRRALSIRSDKEGLLPDSERSSVDSLPLPESPTTG